MGMIGLPSDVIEAASYTASKGALIAMTRELAVQYAMHGIRVNAIAPGFFPTRMTAGVLEHSRQRIEKATPLGRLGQDGDLKGAIVFLSSPASDYITGQVLAIDGGMSAA
jgi:gluconate 5-dehydrogenase